MTWLRRLHWWRLPSAAVIAAVILLAACSSGRSVAQPAGGTAAPSPVTTATAAATASPSATAMDARWRQHQDCTVPQGLLPAGARVTSCVALQGGGGLAFGTAPLPGEELGSVGLVVGSRLVTLCEAPPEYDRSHLPPGAPMSLRMSTGPSSCGWQHDTAYLDYLRRSNVALRYPAPGDVWVAAADQDSVVFSIANGQLIDLLATAPPFLPGWGFSDMAYEVDAGGAALHRYIPAGQACADARAEELLTTGTACNGEGDAARAFLGIAKRLLNRRHSP